MTDSDLALEVLLEFLNAVEAGVAAAKQQLKEKKAIEDKQERVAIKEETFTILKFEPMKGAKIGDYEVAHKANNLEDKWTHAYSVLRQNNATISSRYHGESYEFGYWLYGTEKIYRQKPKPKQT
jgi:hypothetical protein